MATEQEFRAYARLEDADYDNDISISICYESAVDIARDAGVPPLDGSRKYDILIFASALYLYENRGFSPGVAVDGRTQSDWVRKQMTAYLKTLEIKELLRAEGGNTDGDP